MYCTECGTPLQADARFCSKCGRAILTSAATIAAPLSAPADQSGAIWNPNAASNWSLIFSPAFGSYLHALNWRTLGETDKAKLAMSWFYLSLAMLAVYVLISLFSEDAEQGDSAASGLGFLYLIVWYFSAGRPHARYVKEKFGTNYPRRGWGKPLLIGVAAIIGYLLLAVIIGAMVGSVTA